ncbi:EMSY N-terminal domain-containing protein [Strongyloides ratti]|uniref:EMSY N-terminal domain-containing protein n=1 Tax=Strongyloides ratti TaxID=34506 RepID=A0A090KUQ4_STRRB|nr:EMSY N-terminal domain-containing protein [Strongyloides ratti]CEF61210.1 EMSY N-terminal domain-containing protein [Strongyloides ratti]
MSVPNFLQLSNCSTIEKDKNNQNLADVLQNLEDLNQIAFESCMKAFRANGNLNSYQFLLLSHLKYIFSITTEMAKRISRRIANDIELITLAENLNPGIDVRKSWNEFCCEQTPTTWLSFKNETFENFFKGSFSCINEYNFKKGMPEYDEEKSLSILKRLYTIKQEPFVIDRYKIFLEEIGVNLSAENDQVKPKRKCGRPKKDATNNTKNQNSEVFKKRGKHVEKDNNSNRSNSKLEKNKTKEAATSYVGNLGKKEMHTMICQRVIPISDTYKRKIINRSIVLRKRVALGEMSTPEVSQILESSKNSESNTSKEKSPKPTELKRRKLTSTLSNETDEKNIKKIPKNSAFSKTPSYKFMRKSVFSSEKNSPKFVIRPIACAGNNLYSIPKVIFKANNSNSIKKIDHMNNTTRFTNDSSQQSLSISDYSTTYENLSDSPSQKVEEIKSQINGKHSENISLISCDNIQQSNIKSFQFIASSMIETDKNSTYNISLNSDSSKVVK